MEQPAQPAPASRTPASAQANADLSSTNVNKLGVFLDGWADLIEGKGAKAAEVKQTVYQQLLERKMPDIQVKQVNGSVGIGSNKRPYNIATTHPSATTAIYVGEHGQDMYVSWRTFIKPQISNLVIILGLISLVFGAFAAFSIYSFQVQSMFYSVSGSDFGWLILTTLFTVSIGMFISFCFLLAILGVIIKGDFRAYFFVEPNIFDAEDITAMGLSAHKSIIRSLDSTGEIDISKLRLKQNFKGGRSSETV